MNNDRLWQTTQNSQRAALNTPLSRATVGGHELVKKLLDRGDVSPDRSDNNRYTALSQAADSEREQVAKQLLGREDVNPPSQTTETGTHFRGLRYEGPNQWLSKFWIGKTPNLTGETGRSGLFSGGLFNRDMER